jgi:hypothetical protein
MLPFMGVRAQVKRGRLVVDEATSLPDGTVLDLVVDDEGDDLDARERKVLHAAIADSWAEAKAGKVRPAAAVIKDLKKRR